MGNALGGRSLGTASGRIIIDTSDLSRVSAATQQVGQQVERNLGRIGVGAKAAQSNIRDFAAVFGVSFGVAGALQLARFAVEVDAVATAYDRQNVAAVNLAGSQANLNELLAAYDKATGGAIDKATALADVTRLQAIGFADNAEELEKFSRVARGISVATGARQDYIISQLTLAIANQSTMRLDQLGLSVTEVEARIKALQTADKSLSKEMAYQNAILGIAEEKFGALADSAEAQATGAEKASKAWKDLRLALGQIAQEPVGETLGGWAGFLNDAMAASEDLQGGIAGIKRELDNLLPSWLGWEAPPWMRILGRGLTGRLGFDIISGAADFFKPREVSQFGRFEARRTPALAASAFTEEQTQVIADHYAAVREIEAQANADRLEETRQYESQRSDTIRQYETSIAREAEDFARSRQRQQAEFERSIADVREDASKRDTEATADHEERLAELREDNAKRVAEMEEDYARQRENALADHNDKLRDAASRLDARAIYEEQRRFARESQQAEKAHKEQLDDTQDALDERTRDEQEAYQERLEEGRRADEERIQDMRDAFVEQQRLEDEDRRIRLERQAADHQAQLAEQDNQHALRLEQIGSQAAAERAALETEFRLQLGEDEKRNTAWWKQQQKLKDDSLKLFEEWWGAINQRLGGGVGGMGGAVEGRPRAVPQMFQAGGPVLSSGLAMVHAGEYVLPRGGGSRAMTLNANIIVNESARPGQTGAEIRAALIALLREAA